jgi:predicted DNA-binding transcriptional regulator AlpA
MRTDARSSGALTMDEHLDENQLAKRLSLSPRTIQRWRQDGKGPPYLKLGRRIVYRLPDILAWEQAFWNNPSDNSPKPRPEDEKD